MPRIVTAPPAIYARPTWRFPASFFTVNGPGSPLYITQRLDFRLRDRWQLTSPGSYRCAIHLEASITQAQPLIFPTPADYHTQDGVVAGKLEIVRFHQRGRTIAWAAGTFRLPDPAVRPLCFLPGPAWNRPTGASNTGPCGSAVRPVQWRGSRICTHEGGVWVAG